jgi:lysyl-tRNA synthetase class 2
MPNPVDFMPDASWDQLRARAHLLRQTRTFFDDRGFLEVDTPLLSHDTVIDRHLDPIPVRMPEDPRQPDQGPTMWLQTSPEFAMKRLLAAGAEAIYQVTHAFRGAECGAFHNPEFTIVEWYRAGDDLQAGMKLLDELSQMTLKRGFAEYLSYAEAFEQHVAVNPHDCPLDDLKVASRRLQLAEPASAATMDRDAWLDFLLIECIEPHLGRKQPTIIYDYPASQAALANTRPGPPTVAERFELYVDGIELANGYHELTDAEVLRERAAKANQARRSDGKYTLPEDNRLLAAMQHGLPPSTGVALGFDRLVMVATGAKTLSEVMAFPHSKA